MTYEEVYNEKLKLATNAIVAECKKLITNNWNSMFGMWLSCEADWEFPHVYEKYMKEQFEKYMTKDIKNALYFSAINLLYAICAFIKLNKDVDLDDVIEFTDAFFEEQFENFDNWCDEIRTAMYEESPEYARDCAGN